MSVYMSRLFPKSNSSIYLQSGNALKAKVVRLREDTYIIDAGVGRAKTALTNELVNTPKSDGPASFSTKVGYLHPVGGDSAMRGSVLQRLFVDIVTGDEQKKLLAASRFEDMLGQTDTAGGGEQPLLLPRKFRQKQAFLELKNAWKFNRKVKGFIVSKARGGYTVAIAGYIAYLPGRHLNNRGIDGDRYVIEKFEGGLNLKEFTVAKTG